MSSLPKILNHLIWMSDNQVMAKIKTWFKKKGTTFPLKPNIFSIQFFPPLRTTTKPNNHSKQGFYTKKRYFKPPNKYPYKSLTSSIQNSIHKFLTYPYLISSSPWTSLLPFFSSSSSSLLLFSSLSLFSSSLFLYVKSLPK